MLLMSEVPHLGRLAYLLTTLQQIRRLPPFPIPQPVARCGSRPAPRIFFDQCGPLATGLHNIYFRLVHGFMNP